MNSLVKEYYNADKGFYKYLLIAEDGKIFIIDGCLKYEMTDIQNAENALKQQRYKFTGGEMYR